MSDAILALERVTKRYGGVVAVDACSFTVQRGVITGLIGPNGSGKTTLLNVISSVVKPDSGAIRFEGRPIQHLSAAQVNRAGIARTFQRPRVFRELTVLENLLAVHPRGGDAPFRDQVRDVARRLDLVDHLTAFAGDLPFPYQKRLELGRALLTGPRLLMLDEVFAGVDTQTVERVVEYLWELVADGLSILVVDHNMEIMMDLCDSVLVLDCGRLLAQGSPAEVQANERVLTAYLGGGEIRP